MVKVTFYTYRDNSYKGFKVSGHANYAEIGEDILCSAISALTINTINSIEELTSNHILYEMNESGTIKFKFESPSDKDGQLIVNTLFLGITNIYKEYGDEYLQVYFKEV